MKTKLKLRNIFNLNFINPISFYKENKKWFILTVSIFSIAFVGGVFTYFYPHLNIFYPLIKAAFNDLAKIADSLRDVTFIEKVWTIFLNNITVVGIILIGGLFLAIVPLFIVILNGLVLGFFSMMILFSDFSIFAKVAMFITLIPHGVIELFSVFVALSHSFKLGIDYLLPGAKGKRKKTFFSSLKETPTIFIFAILGLTLAAIIEVLDMIILKVLVK